MSTNCENCVEKCEPKTPATMPETVPYAVYESVIDRSAKQTKNWMIAFFVTLALLFVTNAGWIIYESQFETVSYDQDGEGINNVNVGDQGDVINGADRTPETEEEQSNSEGNQG